MKNQRLQFLRIYRCKNLRSNHNIQETQVSNQILTKTQTKSINFQILSKTTSSVLMRYSFNKGVTMVSSFTFVITVEIKLVRRTKPSSFTGVVNVILTFVWNASKATRKTINSH